MSIKPVAWMKNAKQGKHTSLIFTGFETEGFEPLFPAIPDTHRVVSVELLNSIMELAGIALVYQPFGTKDRQNFDALMAIIEDKP